MEHGTDLVSGVSFVPFTSKTLMLLVYHGYLTRMSRRKPKSDRRLSDLGLYV